MGSEIVLNGVSSAVGDECTYTILGNSRHVMVNAVQEQEITPFSVHKSRKHREGNFLRHGVCPPWVWGPPWQMRSTRDMGSTMGMGSPTADDVYL